MFLIITYGLVAVLLCVLVEAFMARRQGRKPDTGAALVSGAATITYFIIILHMAGVLP